MKKPYNSIVSVFKKLPVIFALICVAIFAVVYAYAAHEESEHRTEMLAQVFPVEQSHSSKESEVEDAKLAEWVENFIRTFDPDKAWEILIMNEETLRKLRVAQHLMTACTYEMNKPKGEQRLNFCKAAVQEITRVENDVSIAIMATNAAIKALKKYKLTEEVKNRIHVYEQQIAAYENNSQLREFLKDKNSDIYNKIRAFEVIK